MAARKSLGKWTAIEIDLLKRLGPNKLATELVGLFPGHSACAIREKRRRLGIVKADDFNAMVGRHAQSKLDCDKLCSVDQTITIDDLDNTTLQILLGSILGDGSISKNQGGHYVRNFCFSEKHAVEQRDYVEWKAQQLSLFKPAFIKRDACLRTCSHRIFTLVDMVFG